MKQYYYANGDQQLGPFSFEELKAKRIQKDTYIWYEGLTDWTRAADLPELSELFEAPPTQTHMQNQAPPLSETADIPAAMMGDLHGPRNQRRNRFDDPSGVKPKTWLVESILVTIFCCFIIGGIIGIVYASQVDSKWALGDEAGAKQASDNAKLAVLITFGIGIVIWGSYIFSIIYALVIVGDINY